MAQGEGVYLASSTPGERGLIGWGSLGGGNISCAIRDRPSCALMAAAYMLG